MFRILLPSLFMSLVSGVAAETYPLSLSHQVVSESVGGNGLTTVSLELTITNDGQADLSDITLWIHSLMAVIPSNISQDLDSLPAGQSHEFGYTLEVAGPFFPDMPIDVSGEGTLDGTRTQALFATTAGGAP